MSRTTVDYSSNPLLHLATKSYNFNMYSRGGKLTNCVTRQNYCCNFIASGSLPSGTARAGCRATLMVESGRGVKYGAGGCVSCVVIYRIGSCSDRSWSRRVPAL